MVVAVEIVMMGKVGSAHVMLQMSCCRCHVAGVMCNFTTSDCHAVKAHLPIACSQL